MPRSSQTAGLHCEPPCENTQTVEKRQLVFVEQAVGPGDHRTEIGLSAARRPEGIERPKGFVGEARTSAPVRQRSWRQPARWQGVGRRPDGTSPRPTGHPRSSWPTTAARRRRARRKIARALFVERLDDPQLLTRNAERHRLVISTTTSVRAAISATISAVVSTTARHRGANGGEAGGGRPHGPVRAHLRSRLAGAANPPSFARRGGVASAPPWRTVPALTSSLGTSVSSLRTGPS